MTKDHVDRKKHPLTPFCRLLFKITLKTVYMPHLIYRVTHTPAFVTPVVKTRGKHSIDTMGEVGISLP